MNIRSKTYRLFSALTLMLFISSVVRCGLCGQPVVRYVNGRDAPIPAQLLRSNDG